MNTKKIRGMLGLTRAEFSRRYGIPVRTLENWDRGVSKAPDWTLALLERVVREDAEEEERLEEEAKKAEAERKAKSKK